MHYGCGASVYDTSCAGDVPLGNDLIVDVRGANQVRGEEGGGETLHFKDGCSGLFGNCQVFRLKCED
jgi:hypothetical protein